MCISATVSFSMAGLLMAGGGYCVYKARQTDPKYLPLALFPVLVGIQQFMEGYVWTGFNLNNQNMMIMAALVYLFFTWLVWPVWVPFMVRRMEPKAGKRKWLLCFSVAGGLLGLLLYTPNLLNPAGLDMDVIHHSIAYRCTLVTETFIPRWFTYFLYLVCVGIPPLLSSHLFMRIFGMGLIAAVPVTYLFFSYAHVSVLCFFAALLTVYLIYVIVEDKCATGSRKILHG